MCGIAGIIWSDPERTANPEITAAPLASIRHRGPDGAGSLVVPGFAGGMRRLAIIDLAGGEQPVFNETGEIGILYNGELYNYRELRRRTEQRGHRYYTQSDTEVLVHLYEEFGPDFVRDLDGMFAFAIWDAKKQSALLARDRFGIKPLYLTRTPEGLAFASETKSLAAAGWVTPEIDPSMLGSYFRFAYVPQPATMWRGVEQLPPGHLLEVRRGTPLPSRRYHRHRLGGAPRRSAAALDREVEELLRAAVRRQLIADVPVGLFLSGGLDSSMIAAVASQLGASLPCHTIEFRSVDRAGDPVEEDAPYAREVARHFGLLLHVHTLSPDAAELLPRLLRHMDDPAADPAILTAYMIAEAARPVSKVLLSGMGADELAGGYRRHVAARALAPFYGLPERARAGIASAAWRGAGLLRGPSEARYPALRRIRKVLSGVRASTAELPESLATWTSDDLLQQLGVAPPATRWDALGEAFAGELPDDPLEACLAFDLAMYLPSHNLLYVDKATMAASVETRVPFLDNDLSAFLLGLPPEQKVSGTTMKVALRRAARGMLPPSILKRRKTGFGAPIRAWLGRELRPMVDDLLSPEAVRRRGLLDPAGVAAILDTHRRGTVDVAYTVWALLSLEVWCREVLDDGTRRSALSASTRAAGDITTTQAPEHDAARNSELQDG